MIKTIWDNIYKEYEKNGTKWASLSDGIHPYFVDFIKNNQFKIKSVLDLGCGNGKYLNFLEKIGFNVLGIDSSPTAIKMAKKLLNRNAKLFVEDIYKASKFHHKFDLIISVAAIQHSDKISIRKLIDRIHKSLISKGKIFITFPRMSSFKGWKTFQNSKKTEKISYGTYIPLSGPEKGLIHSFYSKNELENLFSNFKNVKILRDNVGRWVVIGEK